MTLSNYSGLSILVFAFIACEVFAKDNAIQKPLTATAALSNSSGEQIGNATLVETLEGVTISLRASNLPPGKHGLHFHETGICTLPDFKTAGEHFNPKRKEHGMKNPKGPHAGDLPDIEVKDDGTVLTEIKTKSVTLKKGRNSLLKRGETALVIHAKSDDQLTDPSGDSGDRIACGVVEGKNSIFS